mgnify:CR=1 FL=1
MSSALVLLFSVFVSTAYSSDTLAGYRVPMTYHGSTRCERVLTDAVFEAGPMGQKELAVLFDHVSEQGHPMAAFFEKLRLAEEGVASSELPEYSRRYFVETELQKHLFKNGDKTWAPAFARRYADAMFLKGDGGIDGFSFATAAKFIAFMRDGGLGFYKKHGLSRLALSIEHSDDIAALANELHKIAPQIKSFTLYAEGDYRGGPIYGGYFAELFATSMPLERLELVGVRGFLSLRSILNIICSGNTTLKALVLNQANLSGDEMLSLAQAEFSLTDLSLLRTHIYQSNLSTLLRSHKHRLKSLTFDGAANFFPNEVPELVTTILQYQTGLEKIAIQKSSFRTEQFLRIAQSRLPLKELSVSHSLNSDEIKALVEGPLPLEVLRFGHSGTEISLKDLSLLAESKKQFTSVSIDQNISGGSETVDSKEMLAKIRACKGLLHFFTIGYSFDAPFLGAVP